MNSRSYPHGTEKGITASRYEIGSHHCVWGLGNFYLFLISPVPSGDGLLGVLGVPGGPEGPGPLELYGGPDLLDPGSVCALNDLLLHLLCLLDLPGGRLPFGGRAILGLLLGHLLGRGLLGSRGLRVLT